jgi:rhodanese-related sulfurtransferase
MRLLAYIFLLVSSSIISCAQKPSQVMATDFEKAIEDSTVQLLDVRTMAEYNRGHIKNALQANWNNQTEFANRATHLNKEKPVYVYCQAGGRSAAAAQWLRQQGFSNVVDLQGGLIAWQKAKKNVEGIKAEAQYSLDDFKKLIAAKDTLYLVDFGAHWCPPCVKMKPVIDTLQNEYTGKFTLVNIDAGIHTDLLKTLNVNKLPTFIIYKNGVELKRMEEITTKELLIAALFGK